MVSKYCTKYCANLVVLYCIVQCVITTHLRYILLEFLARSCSE